MRSPASPTCTRWASCSSRCSPASVPFTGENQVAVAMKHVREELPDVQMRRPEVSVRAGRGPRPGDRQGPRPPLRRRPRADPRPRGRPRRSRPRAAATPPARPPRSSARCRPRPSAASRCACATPCACCSPCSPSWPPQPAPRYLLADRTERGTGAGRVTPPPDQENVSLRQSAAPRLRPLRRRRQSTPSRSASSWTATRARRGAPSATTASPRPASASTSTPRPASPPASISVQSPHHRAGTGAIYVAESGAARRAARPPAGPSSATITRRRSARARRTRHGDQPLPLLPRVDHEPAARGGARRDLRGPPLPLVAALEALRSLSAWRSSASAHEPVDELRVGQAAGRPQLPVHARLREAGHRVELVEQHRRRRRRRSPRGPGRCSRRSRRPRPPARWTRSRARREIRAGTTSSIPPGVYLAS